MNDPDGALDRAVRALGGDAAAGVVAVPGRVGVVWVEGPDAPRFLQGLLSCDVAAIPEGGTGEGLLLDARGHIGVHVRIHRDSGDAFTLVADPGPAAELAEALRRYQHSEDLEVIGPEPSPTLTLAGDAATHGALAVPGLVPGTVELVVDDADAALALLGARPAPAEAVEVLRVERGVPRVGADTGARTLVQEMGLQDRMVSFTKGCYLGQETVARVQHRGGVNRVLRGVASEDALTPGAELVLDDRPVGTVTSAVRSPRLGWIALAVLRREAAPGTLLGIAHTELTGRVVELPFP